MQAPQFVELALAVYGGASAVRSAARALLRRRRRRRGVKGPIPPRPPCPVAWCIGHDDVLHHPDYRRGHAQPCWSGEIDPDRMRRL